MIERRGNLDAMTKDECCDNCRFRGPYRALPSDRIKAANCQRFPPEQTRSGPESNTLHSDWPLIRSTDWCGEFSKRLRLVRKAS